MPREIQDVDSASVATALLGHPYRMAIIAALEQRGTASPSEVAEHLEVAVDKLSYHFRVLRDAGLVELVATEVAGTTVRRMYRLGPKPRIGPSAWDALPRLARKALTGKNLDAVWRLTAAAAATGCMDDPESVVARVSVRLDTEGFSEIAALLSETLDRLHDIEERACQRLEASGEEPRSATVLTMLFDTPDPAAVLSLDPSVASAPPRPRRRARRAT